MYQTILQPNGYFALWSTVSDDFIECNLTSQKIFSFYKNRGYSFFDALQMLETAFKPENKDEWSSNISFLKSKSGTESHYVKDEKQILDSLEPADFSLAPYSLYSGSTFVLNFHRFSELQDFVNNVSKENAVCYVLRDRNSNALLIVLEGRIFVSKDWVYGR